MADKRRKTSTLTGLELMVALKALKDLVKKSRQEEALNMEVSEEDLEVSEELEQLEAVLEMLESKNDTQRLLSDVLSQSYSFSHRNSDLMEKMKLSFSGFLVLKDDISHPDKPDSFGGAAGLWSADMLYHHLQLLERLVPRTNEGATRLWINAFFFRVAAMTPNMLLSVEQGVLSLTGRRPELEVAGSIDWTAVIAKSTNTYQKFLNNARLQDLKSQDTALLVSEAKAPSQRLEDHVPQAICEMYGCARTAGKTTIRGVLTNGRGWMFLILKLNQDGSTYLQSQEINTHSAEEYRLKLSKDAVSLIPLIIAHWMKHSHEDLDLTDDYFTNAL